MSTQDKYSPPQYDVRVVRFIKYTPNNHKTYSHICLGHFDCASFESLTANDTSPISPLKLIRQDRQKSAKDENNYEYPLYLLKERRDQTHNFWQKQCIYTIIIRVHCAPGFDLSTLASRIKSTAKNSTVIEYLSQKALLHNSSHTLIDFELYDSLELGDKVIVLKGNSLVAALEVSKLINRIPDVRDTYTYCTINKVYLSSYYFNLYPQDLNSSQKLTHVTTRFSIKSPSYANQFLENNLSLKNNPPLQEKLYYITGTADLLYSLGPCSEYDFLKHMQTLADSGLSASPLQNSILHQAFNDTITRIGLTYDLDIDTKENASTRIGLTYDLGINTEKTANNVVDNHSQEKIAIASFISEVLPLCDKYRWASPIKRLLGTLLSMSENYVMDDLANLLLPSVCALIYRIDYMLKYNELTEAHDQEILDFLDAWIYLTNDITHLESQLVQHPELFAIRHYIPVMMLQFEQQFVRECSVVLSQGKRSFIPMLVPSMVQNISTWCPLNPHHTNYSDSCPLQTWIPLDLLYDPWIVAHQLCHEVAHYCGDVERWREKRKEILCACMADFLLTIWESRMSNPDLSEDDLSCHRDLLRDKISASFNNTEKAFYLSDVASKIEQEIVNLSRDEQLYRDFQNTVLFGASYATQLMLITKDNGTEQKLFTVQDEVLKEHLNYLVSLCKECYADIAMITLLDCSLDNYAHCVYHDEMKRIYHKSNTQSEVNWKTERSAQLHISRFALVYHAVSNVNKRNWEFTSISKDERSWLEESKRRIDILSGSSKEFWNDNDTEYLFPFEDLYLTLTKYEVELLSNYLIACAKSLHTLINGDFPPNSQRIKKLRNILEAVKDSTFDWSKLQKFVNSEIHSECNRHTLPQLAAN